MKLYFKVILFNYLKYFLILFFGIDAVFLGIDMMLNYGRIPDLPGYFTHYLLYTSVSGISYILPICIILALLLSKFSMIKNGELIVFYALGISKKQIVMPNFLCAFLITIAFIGLNYTDFAYAIEYKNNIVKRKSLHRNIEHLFFTHEDKVIYIGEYKYHNMKNIDIYTIKDNKIISNINAKNAYFKDNEWVLQDVVSKEFYEAKNIGDKSIKNSTKDNLLGELKIKPEVFKGLGLKDAISIKDAFYLYLLLKEQNLDTTKIKGLIYEMAFVPLFAPFLVVIMFYFLPNMRRYGDFGLVSLALVLLSLVVYGILMFLTQIAISGTILPEISIVLPVTILAFIAFWFYSKKS